MPMMPASGSVPQIVKNAFASGATGKCYTCNGGQYPAGDTRSFVQAMKDNTGITMPGMVGRIDYAPAGGGLKNIANRAHIRWMGFEPSLQPQPGNQATYPGWQDNPSPGKKSYWTTPK